jgi:mitogen-activated protein kinase kinase kinase
MSMKQHTRDGVFSSPTASEFSEACDGHESIRYALPSTINLYPTSHLTCHRRDRSWDEKHVVDWLHSIRCGQYEGIFKGMTFTCQMAHRTDG